ncbi:hypothetical protein HAX54_014964 [Datura stramonium]|uniref:Uncharacterized protein n=1 Tax=Datura stramonium TaxID=4076 RepID=A0ABS8Y3U3_DATST|nr:hypothetical protein [Datura stramonium]
MAMVMEPVLQLPELKLGRKQTVGYDRLGMLSYDLGWYQDIPQFGITQYFSKPYCRGGRGKEREKKGKDNPKVVGFLSLAWCLGLPPIFIAIVLRRIAFCFPFSFCLARSSGLDPGKASVRKKNEKEPQAGKDGSVYHYRRRKGLRKETLLTYLAQGVHFQDLSSCGPTLTNPLPKEGREKSTTHGLQAPACWKNERLEPDSWKLAFPLDISQWLQRETARLAVNRINPPYSSLRHNWQHTTAIDQSTNSSYTSVRSVMGLPSACQVKIFRFYSVHRFGLVKIELDRSKVQASSKSILLREPESLFHCPTSCQSLSFLPQEPTMAFDASTISLPSSRASDSIARSYSTNTSSVEESRKETTAVILIECSTAYSDSLYPIKGYAK